MRATKIEQIQPQEKGVQPAWTGQGNEARLSLRFVTWLELISVISSVLLTVWAIVPLYPQNRLVLVLPALLALSLIGYSHHIRHEGMQELGLSKSYGGPALRLLLVPVVLCSVVLLLIGYLSNSLRRSTHFEVNLVIVPLWGIVQQYVLQGFIFRRVRMLMVNEGSYEQSVDQQVRYAILVTATIFAIVHLPNLTLSLLTFTAALFWSWVYEQAPNLWVLGLSHGLLSLIVMHSLPDWLLQSMSVGYKHFLYQKF